MMTMRPCFFVIDDDASDGDSYHEWLIAEGYNETVTEFNIMERSSDPEGNETGSDIPMYSGMKMKSYCFDFKEEQCYFNGYNWRNRDLQYKQKMSSEVGGIGSATLAFPGVGRKLRNAAGEDRDLQQNEPETFGTEIGLNIEVSPQEEGIGGFRTAGGFSLGIQATSSAFFAVVGTTGLFLGNILV